MSRKGDKNEMLRGLKLISQNKNIPSMQGIKSAFRENGIGQGQETSPLDQSKEETARLIWVVKRKRPGPLFQNKSETYEVKKTSVRYLEAGPGSVLKEVTF